MEYSIISNKEIKIGEAVKGKDIRKGVYHLIKKRLSLT
jgi:hypothetical protein